MKKILVVLGISAALMALGTGVYAAADEHNGFQEMLSSMKQMHPDLTDQQLEDMYNDCHDNGGGSSSMMKGHMGGMMHSNGMHD